MADHPPEDRVQALRQQLVRNLHAEELGEFIRPPLYATRGARLSDGTAARKLGASVDIVAPGMRSCPYHFHHAQEELFIVLAGQGHLRVAGEMLPLRAGDLVFVPPGPEYPHQIINTGSEPLHYLSISTQERPEVCEYPDSDKIGISGTGQRHRRSATLDYWDGEP